MATDWGSVKTDALAAMQKCLEGKWPTVCMGATGAMQSLIETGRYIVEHKNQMSPDEYKMLMDEQKDCVKRVLTGYESISMAAANNAIAEAVNVIVKAVPALLGIA